METIEANDLADMLIMECDYMESNPLNVNYDQDFKKIYDAFMLSFKELNGEPLNGLIDGDKLFGLFKRIIYNNHYDKMSGGSIASGLSADGKPKEESEEMIRIMYIACFGDFLNAFHDYFTIASKADRTFYYSYEKTNSLTGFIERFNFLKPPQ